MKTLGSEIINAATEWLSRRDQGFTPEDAQAYARWLATDPENHAAIRLLEPTWQAVNRLRRSSASTDLRVYVEQALARRRRRGRRFLAATLATAAVLTVGFVFLRPVPTSPGAVTVSLRPDSRVLPDGSIVELNSDAEIAVDFTPAARTVRLLRGGALFEVAKDALHPFIVDAGLLSVRAVGTAFSVRREAGEINVLVTEGKVAVEISSPTHPPASPVPVDAGSQITVSLAEAAPGLPALRPASPIEVETELSWRNRRVEFSGTPLSEAVGYFNRDNQLQLVLGSEEVGALRISGVFWTDDAEAFARALEASLGLTVFRSGSNRVELRR